MALSAEAESLRSFLEKLRNREGDKLCRFPDSLQNSPTDYSIDGHLEMFEEKIETINKIEYALESSFGSI